MTDAPPVETRGLTKDYGSGRGVFDLDLRVRAGEIYGFLGPNGAGKTTVMRMLVGLVRPTGGSVAVLGGSPTEPAIAGRIGALIESPGLYGHLSGQDNLRYLAGHAGCRPGAVVRVLRQVDMWDARHLRVAKYSLGMRQRLGVAAALLKDPAVLLLDEPTNGLDPEGIAGMRQLVRDLRAEGRTVFLSSHQMSEIEMVCDRVGVLRAGRLVAEDTVDGMSRRRGAVAYAVSTPEAERACAVLNRLGAVLDARVEGGRVTAVLSADDVAGVIRDLVLEGIPLQEFAPAQNALESAFFGLVGPAARMEG